MALQPAQNLGQGKRSPEGKEQIMKTNKIEAGTKLLVASNADGSRKLYSTVSETTATIFNLISAPEGCTAGIDPAMHSIYVRRDSDDATVIFGAEDDWYRGAYYTDLGDGSVTDLVATKRFAVEEPHLIALLWNSVVDQCLVNDDIPTVADMNALTTF